MPSSPSRTMGSSSETKNAEEDHNEGRPAPFVASPGDVAEAGAGRIITAESVASSNDTNTAGGVVNDGQHPSTTATLSTRNLEMIHSPRSPPEAVGAAAAADSSPMPNDEDVKGDSVEDEECGSLENLCDDASTPPLSHGPDGLEKLEDDGDVPPPPPDVLESLPIGDDGAADAYKWEKDATNATDGNCDDGTTIMPPPAIVDPNRIATNTVGDGPPLGLEIIRGDDSAPVPATQTAAFYEAMEEGASGVADATEEKIELPKENDDGDPVPPAQVAAAYQEMEGAAKGSVDDSRGDDDAPPHPGQVAAAHEEDEDDSGKSGKLEFVLEEEGDAPLPAGQVAAALAVKEIGDGRYAKNKLSIEDNVDDAAPFSRVLPGSSESCAVPEAGKMISNPPPNDMGQNGLSPPPRPAQSRTDGGGDVTATQIGGSPNAASGAIEGGTALANENSGDVPSLHVIPETVAYLVEEGSVDRGEVYIAELANDPQLPWYKQRRVVSAMFCVLIFTIAAAVAAVVASRPVPPVPGTQIVTVVREPAGNTTAPTLSSTPTPRPTAPPSSSSPPSLSPTECFRTISSNAGRLDWVNDNAYNPKIAVDGGNAVVAAQDAFATDVAYVAFYSLSPDGDAWERLNFLTVGRDAISTGYDVSVRGAMAAVGFRGAATGAGENAGAVHVYERKPAGVWEMIHRLVPEDGGSEDAGFGRAVALGDDLLCAISSYPSYGGDGAYVFRRVGGEWIQIERLGFFNARECLVSGDTVAVRGYDGVSEFISLNSFREGKVGEEQVIEARLVSGVGLSESHLVYTESYVGRRVSIHSRQGPNGQFTLVQEITAPVNDDDFGKHLVLDRDVLVLRGSDQTHIYSLRDGKFEKVFSLDEPYTTLQGTARNVIATDAQGSLISFNIRDCTQPMPTQMPSSSSAPISSIFTLAPTSSPHPSQSPSFSLSPTKTCYWVDISVDFDEWPAETSWDLEKIGDSSDNGLIKEYAANGKALAALQVDAISYDAWDVRGSAISSSTEADLCDCGLGTRQCECAGKACLLRRGEVLFFEKVGNCMAGGGVGAIIFNNDPGESDLSGFSLGGETAGIPVVMISQADGQHLLAHGIGQKVSMTTKLSHAESVCLVDGNYRFTMRDSEGDGICCGAGKGAYTVTTLTGMIARGRKFTRSESTNFTIPFDPATVSFCSEIDIRISPRKNSGEEGAVSWDLRRQDEGGNTTMVFSSDGPLLSSKPAFVRDCIPDGRYYFTMYDSGSDLSVLFKPTISYEDAIDLSSYSIWTDDIQISSSGIVFHGDTVSFTLPYTEDEEDGNDSDYGTCHNDMVVYIVTDDKPANISWELVNGESGKIVVNGGPYDEPFGGWYTFRACLPDGNFVFTINAQDGLSLPSLYALDVEGVTFVSAAQGADFGSTASHSFTLPLVQMPSSSPTTSSAPSSTSSPTGSPSLSLPPTEACDLIEIRVDFDWLLWPLSWKLRRILPWGDVIVVQDAQEGGGKQSSTQQVCLQEGQYDFSISSDWTENGAFFPGRYNVTVVSTGDLIVRGEGIGEEQRTPFELPLGTQSSERGTRQDSGEGQPFS